MDNKPKCEVCGSKQIVNIDLPDTKKTMIHGILIGVSVMSLLFLLLVLSWY